VSRDKFNGLAGLNETMESSEGGWARFYSEYPRSSGFLSLSRVGFDLRRNQALVCMPMSVAIKVDACGAMAVMCCSLKGKASGG